MIPHCRTVIRWIALSLALLLCPQIVGRTSRYLSLYSNLVGRYCLLDSSSPTRVQNLTIDELSNIRHCSLQNIDACQRIHNQTLLFRLYWDAGFTSELNNLLSGFLYAIHNRRKLLVADDQWNYGPFSSYFDLSRNHFSPWLPSSPECSKRQFAHLYHYSSQATPSFPAHLMISRDPDGGFATLRNFAKPLENNVTSLSMKRIVADYLWKSINNETEHFIRQHLQDLDVDSITYAMHIRRGDKAKEANAIPNEKYLAGVEHFSQRESPSGAVQRVYVATDDSSVVNALRLLRPHWQFVQFPATANQSHSHDQHTFNRLPIEAKIQSARVLITELEILARAKYVVCTFSSNICRFVQILRKQNADTVLSLDSQWFAA